MLEGHVLEIWQRQVLAHWIVERNRSGDDQIGEQEAGYPLCYGTGFQDRTGPKFLRWSHRQSIRGYFSDAPSNRPDSNRTHEPP